MKIPSRFSCSFSLRKSEETMVSIDEKGMERREERREEGDLEISEERDSERVEVREGGEKAISKWGVCWMEREWKGGLKGEMTWKWWRGWEAVERKEERREGELGGKVPTRRMWRERGTEKERREEVREGMEGRGNGEERDFFREVGRVRKVSFVACGSWRDCWAR